MWKGDSLLTTRKLKPVEMPRSKEKLVPHSHRQYLNNKNSFTTFLKDDPKRLQILENYKEINRIITKNYIKKKDMGIQLLNDHDDTNNNLSMGNNKSRTQKKDPIAQVQQAMKR
eukprot:CAMPEP_0197010536 /NCGR_PEP_ID=MMETSP1380-20130617/54723_1 /TAXON_ID=5936 /ORGANISM="Euplotes crassus, Strain CT5" /LENGTH=113 /DNA_ID=CAMNT_0042432521 /DNA_START=511 /DNA_END=849 /DNA_ORIENTATION=+